MMKTIRYQQTVVQLVEELRRINHRHGMRKNLNQTTHPNNYNMLNESKGKLSSPLPQRFDFLVLMTAFSFQ